MPIEKIPGQPAPRGLLVNVPRLVSAYYTTIPDPTVPAQKVAFGTSGHRGSSLVAAFNETHILAVTQAIVNYRRRHRIDGPLFLARDTHALSEPAFQTALEVLAANEVETRIATDDAYTPTPSASLAILSYNRAHPHHASDGIVVTPSHNPPEDGGFKYNPPNGGPADSDVTGEIERDANALIAGGNRDVLRVPLARARASSHVREHDFIAPYAAALSDVLDLEAVRSAGVRIGVDPLGGANVGYWGAIAERHGLALEVVNDVVDPTFGFMPLDHDGKIRMDCSSRFAMANLIRLKDRFDIAFGNDTDSDRHGIVTPSSGLLNPNHYLAVAIDYLFSHRPGWRKDAAIGKTLVSSSLIDRVAARLHRRLAEVPVGFKYFVNGLVDGSYGFGGEESAGASFLRKDGTVWTTDKDGMLLGLLAAEMTAVLGEDPGVTYRKLAAELGEPLYARIDVAATPDEKNILKRLSPAQVAAQDLAGDPIRAKLTEAPEGNASIGGLKVATEHGWFAARPSGTENAYKIYAESFKGPDHLKRIQEEARQIVNAALKAGAAT
ncbi:MAG TPA: phosphoglucomutase (alpha-D-glucose-1,6-bisphosphate-dependent) [Polyangia bacterium]|nr:phosphoglucomutase (alpha-D-glucose-1,6-bisphosphate-dependent) [Polyangia bacterium]